MARPPYEEPPALECQFDSQPLLAAIEQIAGQLESLRATIVSVDQKVTQLRSVEHQNVLQTIKQVRTALDMATRDNKKQLDSLETSVGTATARIRSLDLAMSNRKLEQLAASVAARQRTSTAESQPKKGGGDGS